MNNKVSINPVKVIKYSFKHIFTYKLLFHIMAHYDPITKRVCLDKQDIADRYFTSYKNVSKCIEELIDNEVIDYIEHYKNWYSINSRIIRYEKD